MVTEANKNDPTKTLTETGRLHENYGNQEKLTIEKKAYEIFRKNFKDEKFGNQRLGQAFYNHFDLHKLANQNQLNNLYEKDGEQAEKSIYAIFEFN